jgi:hypothetical protein
MANEDDRMFPQRGGPPVIRPGTVMLFYPESSNSVTFAPPTEGAIPYYGRVYRRFDDGYDDKWPTSFLRGEQEFWDLVGMLAALHGLKWERARDLGGNSQRPAARFI